MTVLKTKGLLLLLCVIPGDDKITKGGKNLHDLFR